MGSKEQNMDELPVITGMTSWQDPQINMQVVERKRTERNEGISFY